MNAHRKSTHNIHLKVKTGRRQHLYIYIYIYIHIYIYIYICKVEKIIPMQCRRQRRCRFDPWVRKISWSRKWQPTPVFLPGKSYRQKSLMGYSPWSCKESDWSVSMCVHAHVCTHTHVLWMHTCVDIYTHLYLYIMNTHTEWAWTNIYFKVNSIKGKLRHCGTSDCKFHQRLGMSG